MRYRVEVHPEYGAPPWPWHAMAGIRNRISHYSRLDYEVVWRVASIDAPGARSYLAPLLDEAEEYVAEHDLEVDVPDGASGTRPLVPLAVHPSHAVPAVRSPRG